MLERVAISFSRELPNPGIKLGSLVLEVNSLPADIPGKPYIYMAYIYITQYRYYIYISAYICIYKMIYNLITLLYT